VGQLSGLNFASGIDGYAGTPRRKRRCGVAFWRNAPDSYAGVRVDIRGCGESDGLLFDEYAKQEQDDGVVASHPSKSCRHRQADIGLTSPQRSLATIGVARIGAIFQVR
jgi:hypothetical protein